MDPLIQPTVCYRFMSKIVAIRSRFAGALAIAALFAPGPAAKDSWAVERNSLLAARASITTEELKSYVDVLADDTFEGREVGSRGGRGAGNYMVKVFEQKGLTPAGEGGT